MSLPFCINNKNNSKTKFHDDYKLAVGSYTWELGIQYGGTITQFRDRGLTSLENLKLFFFFFFFLHHLKNELY